ncbi:helix-turn-helix transcriptional regulator [Salipiger thiooxidans]|uniref:TetR/AcrR family transcriptional regulator n=1 Tax=Salipiger thiooxidans TaxID=282683 RepID=UPI001A8C37F1|nr:helix-turn-helix domain-containing protein [Salipiger thiooxidans]MBN8189955.1 helix-turn-helix transcriptional regulator [Salipiger thiooxidans]
MASMKDDKNGKSLRGRAAAIGLSKGQVVSAAVAQIDEKGLAAFSLRELARSLGVSPAVVYWHVYGWQDLFAERVAQIDRELHPLTAAALPDITNRIFALRWQNGALVSYAESFELLLDLLIEGLKARAAATPS